MHGEQIPEEEFEKMKADYAEQNPGQTQSVLFSKKVFESILSSGASNIRVHFGNNSDGSRTVIFKGEGNQGDLMLLDPNDPPWNRGQLCPPFCP